MAEPRIADTEPESFAEQLSRLRQMAAGDDTWDLSDNDTAAIRAVLDSHARLLAGLQHMQTCSTCAEGSWSECLRGGTDAADAIAKAEGAR